MNNRFEYNKWLKGNLFLRTQYLFCFSSIKLNSIHCRTRTRIQTFFDGSEMSPGGVVHIPMEPAFSNNTRQVIIDSLKELGFSFHDKGTAVCIEGPRFSSRAESYVFKSWNAQLVNMTLVPEVLYFLVSWLSIDFSSSFFSTLQRSFSPSLVVQ